MASVDTVKKIAKAEVGYHEGRSANGSWNNNQKFSKELPGFDWSNYQAWCATFVCWVFWKAGLYSLLPSPSAGCDQLASGFKKNGRWSEYPAIGAVIFFGTHSDLQHTGVVVDYDGTYVYTVEGNTNTSGSYQGDGVYAKKHLRRDPRVIGYGYPKYTEGIKSADPAYANQPAPTPAPAAKTRGSAVDHAIADLKKAKADAASTRGKQIKLALDALSKVPYLK